MYTVYILECGDGTLYTGITTDMKRRFLEHVNKKGASYTTARGVRKIVYTETVPDRSLASKREAEIKKLSRKDKLRLCTAGHHKRSLH